jgi:hypothetical protein
MAKRDDLAKIAQEIATQKIDLIKRENLYSSIIDATKKSQEDLAQMTQNKFIPYTQDNIAHQRKTVDAIMKQSEQMVSIGNQVEEHQRAKYELQQKMIATPIEELGNRLDERLTSIDNNSVKFNENLQELAKTQQLLAEYVKQSGDESSELTRTGIKQNKWVLFFTATALFLSIYTTFITSDSAEEVSDQTIQTNPGEINSYTENNTLQSQKPDKTVEPSKTVLQAVQTSSEQIADKNR